MINPNASWDMANCRIIRVFAVAVILTQTTNTASASSDIIDTQSSGSQEKLPSTSPDNDVQSTGPDNDVQSTGSDNNVQSNISDVSGSQSTRALWVDTYFFSVYGSGNLALNKRTMQSSLHGNTDYRGVASNAVDGDVTGDYRAGHCTHTDFQLHSWWAVDLGQAFTVHAVTIVNRQDCCGYKLSNFYIGVTDVSPHTTKPSIFGPSYKVCWYQKGYEPDVYHTFRCNSPIVGRYVVIQLSASDPLHICEVQVEGTTGGLRNLALHKPTFQSSVSHGGVSSRAVNGNINPYWISGSCSHTVIDEINPWWAVDLGTIKQVYTVTLVNRVVAWYKLKNFHIGVTNSSPPYPFPLDYPLCVQHYSVQGPGTTVDYACMRPLSGRYVVVQIVDRGTLHLCEVMVFGR